MKSIFRKIEVPLFFISIALATGSFTYILIYDGNNPSGLLLFVSMFTIGSLGGMAILVNALGRKITKSNK